MLGYLQHRSLRVVLVTRLVRARMFPLAAGEEHDRENRCFGRVNSSGSGSGAWRTQKGWQREWQGRVSISHELG